MGNENTPVTPSENPQPLAEYRQRLHAREHEAEQLKARDARLGFLRLALAVVFVGVLWRAWHGHPALWWLVPIPVLCFLPVAAVQIQGSRLRKRKLRAAAMYTAGIARIEGTWPGMGQQEPRGPFKDSLFAADLDLFGRQSIFALLSTARTRMGEDTLAGWLLQPASPQEVLRRQAAVVELRGRLDLREDAAVLGVDAGSAVQGEALLRWAEAPPLLKGGAVPLLAGGIALLMTAAVAAWALTGARVPLFLMLIVAGSVHMAFRRRVEHVVQGTDRALADLDLLAALLLRLQQEPFTAPMAVALQQVLRGTEGEGSASQAIEALRRVGAYLDARENLLVKAVNIPLLYAVQMAFAAERWRARHGARVRLWLDAAGQMEALLSIAAYSYEHPSDPFPEIVTNDDTESGTRPLLEGSGIAHPLLPAGSVRNDVRLDGAEPILLISGSNMSGKSTLLRAVGVNVVLAMAGAPVRAERLRLSPLQVGASILVNDSLAEGASRFYAEIRRLRALCDLALRRAPDTLPLLFLLDELLEGTNSHDRQVGAAGILRTLAERGAIGMVTTHDLALTAGYDTLPMVNRHFEDTVRDGRMAFDYILRDGVVTRSNGVALMRLVGLDV